MGGLTQVVPTIDQDRANARRRGYVNDQERRRKALRLSYLAYRRGSRRQARLENVLRGRAAIAAQTGEGIEATMRDANLRRIDDALTGLRRMRREAWHAAAVLEMIGREG